jgi:multisubunit Na+/H+ antiporter MnhF subunit
VLIYIIGFAIYFSLFLILRRFISGGTQPDGLFALGIILAAVCALVAFGITRTATATFPNGIYQNALAYFILVPVAAISVCMAVGSMVGQYKERPNVQGSILFLALLTAIASGATSHLLTELSERAKENHRAEMEQTNVSGTFGKARVSIPVSPIVSIGTRCRVEPGQSHNNCNASFGQPNTFEYFRGFEAADLNFAWMIVRSPGQDCRIKVKCEEFQDWCARRSDLVVSEWCQTVRKVKVVMTNKKKKPSEEDFDVPLLEQSNPDKGLRIRCRYHPKNVWCKAHFQVAPEVRTIVTVGDIEPGHEETVVLEAVSYAQSLWLEMTGDK